MAVYLVQLPDNAGQTKKGGGNLQVVVAASEAQAKEVAAAALDGDGGSWGEATVTEVTSTASWVGWKFKITIHGGFGTGNTDPLSVTVTGDATNNTIDEIAALFVTAFNAHADIAGAAYNATTQTLTVSDATDALGDQKLTVEITPPSGYSTIPSLVGTIVDEGSAAAELSVVLPADTLVAPISMALAKVV